MEMRVQIDENAFMPVRAHDTDAGADLMTPVAFTIGAHESFTVSTGVHIELPTNTVGMLKSKSGLNVKFGIVSEGVIDEGYSGEIIVKLYNHSDKAHRFERGDKITQLVVFPVLYVDLVKVDAIVGGERGDAGFGSSGR